MIPDFIYLELVGPYGLDVLQKLGRIERYYTIYQNGAEFQVDESDGYIPAKLPSKQIKKLIRREAQFLFGKTPELRVTCPEEEKKDDKDKPNETAMQAHLDAVLKASRWPDKLIKGARDCFIGARVALKLNISPENVSVMFVPADGFVYETDIDDVDRIERIVFFYTMKDDKERERQRIWVQKFWMDGERCKVSERITDGHGRPIEWDGTKEDSDTGLDRIPAYVILNDGLSGDTDGESEITDLMRDDSWYGRMKSANIDTLRKGMNQVTWMSGVKPDSFEKLRFSPGALWDLQGDPAQAAGDSNAAAVQVDTVSNDFAYAGAYGDTLSNIKRDMHDLTGVPDLDLESTRNLITSGKGLKALYWPLISRCEEKMTAWRPALEWLADTILYAAAQYPGLMKKYGAFSPAVYQIAVDNQYPLPEDEDEERSLDLSEVTNKARSVKSYLIKWGGADRKGLSEDEANEEIEQMARERELLEDSFTGLQDESPPGGE